MNDEIIHKEGSWWIRSKKDPRWNKEGKGRGLDVLSDKGELHKWIETSLSQFGSEPNDIEIGFTIS